MTLGLFYLGFLSVTVILAVVEVCVLLSVVFLVFKMLQAVQTVSFSAMTLLVGWQEGHPACKTLDVGLLMMIWLELCTSYSSSCHHWMNEWMDFRWPPSSLAPIRSRMETFWYVKILENTCHTWALLRWWFTKRCYIKCMYLNLIFTSPQLSK